MTTDCTPRYCYADPVEGGKQAVAEAYRNLCAVGARPLAITNCLNFGNPQRPEIMAQIVGCLQGMSEACIALDMPIVSGNVSLYNESKATGGGSAILPTPAIGGVGLLENWEKSATVGFKAEREAIFLLGMLHGELGQSTWLREIHGRSEGLPPDVDLEEERALGEFVRVLISSDAVTAVHDVSDGGTAVAVAEMALAGNIGASLHYALDSIGPQFESAWFAEDQGIYIVTTSDAHRLQSLAHEANFTCYLIGFTGGTSIKWKSASEVPLADLRAAHEGFFRKLMGSELTPEF
jgi:phosphoribosylformylglycinamidine synthase